MTTEQRLDRLETNLDRLADVRNQMMDLLGLTMEGERRLATRMEHLEEIVSEIGNKLNRLIGNVGGLGPHEK